MNQMETGKCMPDSSIMLELCKILGVTVDEVLSIGGIISIGLSI